MKAFLPALLLLIPTQAQEWKPAEPPLMTRWGKQVNPDNVLPEYPRPQPVRQRWMSLNGLWEYAFGGMQKPRPDKPRGYVPVPFPNREVVKLDRAPVLEATRELYVERSTR